MPLLKTVVFANDTKMLVEMLLTRDVHLWWPVESAAQTIEMTQTCNSVMLGLGEDSRIAKALVSCSR